MQTGIAPCSHSTSPWRDKRILVTGASGFLGRHLTRKLLDAGAEIAAVSRISRDSEQPGLTWHHADLEDSPSVDRIVAHVRPAAIFHLSSMANAKRDLDLVGATFRAEVVSTVNVLHAAARYPVEKVLIAGSLEVPDAGHAPSSPYGAAKACSKLYADMFRLLYDVPVISPRIFMCFGPGQPDWKLLPTAIRSFLGGQAPQIASPDRMVDWIFVADAVEGLLAASAAPLAAAQRVDIGTGKLTSIRDIVEKLRDITQPGLDLNFARAQPRAMDEVKCADAEATYHATAWRARTTLEDGLRATIAAIQSQGGG